MKFHKNFHVVAVFAAMIALNAQATPVSSEQARFAVSAWAAANGSAFANPGTAYSAEPEYDTDGKTVLYYKVKMSNGGLVIASPDTDLDLVIAVLENSDGDFPKGHPLPSILKADMRNRLSVIASGVPSSATRSSTYMATAQSVSARVVTPAVVLPDDVKESIRESNLMWEKYGGAGGRVSLLKASLVGGDESPYVRRVVNGFGTGGCYTHWNQSESPVDFEPLYNMYTTNNAVCGCVATAGSAIMQFFGCTNDIGSVKGENCTYNGLPIECNTLSGALDWSLLPTNGVDSVNECLSTNVAARDLAGRIAYNMGVLVGMGWTDDESGAVTVFLADVFKKYGFKTARAVEFGSNAGGTAQYFKTIYAQNWAGAPVVLSIRGEAGGHAVVACGYAKDPDGAEFCRVFMGWGGSGDSWYKFPKIQSFNTVNAAVTMIGLDDDAVVPVCGYSNVPSTEMQIFAPGVQNPVAVVAVDGSGYFAVRVSSSLEGNALTLKHPVTGKELDVSPYDGGILSDESATLEDLEAAIPDELQFLGLNMVTKTSVSAARAKAKEISEANAQMNPPKPGVALLVVSGSGGERDSLLMDLLCHLDATTDISNKFVFVHVNSASLASFDADGDPSIGVFDPYSSSDNSYWQDTNGRLAYANFLAYDKDNLGDELQYIFSATDTVELTNTVFAVSDSGYDSYLRLHSGIEVEVRSIDESGKELTGIDGVEIPYGRHANCWTNGQIAVFTAPKVCTNESVGVMYECVGWTTNAVDVATSVKSSRTVELPLCFNCSVDFAWVWKVCAYRVTAASYPFEEGAVTPAVAWRIPGDRITLSALVSLQNGKGGLSYWEAHDVNDIEVDMIDVYENGNCLSFSVTAPVSVMAQYRGGASVSLPSVTNIVEISVNNEEIADLIGKDSNLACGANTNFDNCANLVALMSAVVDSTGGVWRCTGYVVDGVTNSVMDSTLVDFDPPAEKSIELLWESVDLTPEPGPISIKSLSRSADGEWSIVVEGAVKGCYYTLYAADDISKLAGSSESWPADKIETKQAAADDEPIVFKMMPTANAQFWRVKASGTSE